MLYTLHGINFIRQRVFDGSKDTTEGFYTEAELKKKKIYWDVQSCLAIHLSLKAKTMSVSEIEALP